MSGTAQMRRELRDWILKVNGKISADELLDDTPIIERRIISSLQFVELVLVLERLSGRAIELNKIKPGSFRDINTISFNFFEQ